MHAHGRKIVLFLLGLSLITSGLVWAQQPATPAQPTPPPTGSWKVDAKSSRVYVFVGKTGLGHEHAVIGNLDSGQLTLGANQQAGQWVFDMTSFAADGQAARAFLRMTGAIDQKTQSQVTANMLGADVLDSQRYPKAQFDITSCVVLPQKEPGPLHPIQLDGELTLHGVKRTQRITAWAENQQGRLRVRGEFKLRQTQFGIKPYTKVLGTVGVADELRIWGDLWLDPAGG